MTKTNNSKKMSKKAFETAAVALTRDIANALSFGQSVEHLEAELAALRVAYWGDDA